MRIVAAPDSFKESMTARQAALAMERGAHAVLPEAEVASVPMSDGGEGFVEAVASAWGARLVEVDTVDALGRSIRVRYGLDAGRAVMDVASCAGLELVAPADRDVMASTTAGLGLVIRHALSAARATCCWGSVARPPMTAAWACSRRWEPGWRTPADVRWLPPAPRSWHAW